MLIKISEEVKKALAEHKPVVALESTIISHGMPYPTNVETALKELNVPADLTFVSEAKDLITYGAVSMPAIVINGKLASWGKIISTAGVKNLLYKILQ